MLGNGPYVLGNGLQILQYVMGHIHIGNEPLLSGYCMVRNAVIINGPNEVNHKKKSKECHELSF